MKSLQMNSSQMNSLWQHPKDRRQFVRSAVGSSMLFSGILGQLMADEGFRSAAYQDSLGFWTIGIGRLIDARKGGGITRDEAQVLLRNDIARVEREVRARWPWFDRLDESRQNVLLNMAFNLGTAGLAKFTATLACVERGDYDGAAAQMLRSLWAKQVKARATRLAAQMRG